MSKILLRLLAELSDADVEALVAILNQDTRLHPWLYPGRAARPAWTPEWFREHGRRWASTGRACTYAIVTERPIGTISRSHITPEGTARIGYWLASAEWGRGYGSAAFAGVLEQARQMGLQAVSATIDPANAASLAIWMKQGARPTVLGANAWRVDLVLGGGKGSE